MRITLDLPDELHHVDRLSKEDTLRRLREVHRRQQTLLGILKEILADGDSLSQERRASVEWGIKDRTLSIQRTASWIESISECPPSAIFDVPHNAVLSSGTGEAVRVQFFGI